MDISVILNTAVAFQIGPLSVRWYGIIISLGMALGIYLAYREVNPFRHYWRPALLCNFSVGFLCQ